MKLNNIFKRFSLLSFPEWLLLVFPFFSVLGPTYVNLLLIISSIYFIYFLVRFKAYNYLRLNWVYLYLIFFLYVICTSFFATNYIHALQNSFSQIRFLLFSLFIYLCVANVKNFDLVIKTWSFFILFVAFDTLIQFYFGYDIFGKESPGHPNRLSGPFGKELIVGAFISIMSVPLLSYFYEKINDFNFKFIFFFLIYSFLITILALSGERLSFLIFLSSTAIILVLNSNFKKILIFSFFLISLLIIIYTNNNYVKNRVNDFNNIINVFNILDNYTINDKEGNTIKYREYIQKAEQKIPSNTEVKVNINGSFENIFNYIKSSLHGGGRRKRRFRNRTRKYGSRLKKSTRKIRRLIKNARK